MAQLGIIADDFTGATDIASFLVENGMSTVQLNGTPPSHYRVEAEALVISLKSRSSPVEQAISQSLEALCWLQQQGCQQFYFKYCSTFDSTAKGNIGPVTDALLDALGESQTVISPALPINGRTVYLGYLFVMQQLLAESGMRHHPVTPMTDSNLLRLMESQAKGRCGLVPFVIMEQGATAVSQHLAQLKQQGIRYVVLDALSQQHLLTQGTALRNSKLVTGGSGLAIGLAQQWRKPGQNKQQAQAAGAPAQGRAVILSGSCSVMTNQQVSAYRQQASAMAIDVEQCLNGEVENYAAALCQWVERHADQTLAPLLYATTDAEKLSQIQQRWGADTTSKAVETLFAHVAIILQSWGFQRFIVAGGETAGVVVQSLKIKALHIGPAISPGVPWVKSTDYPIWLALKSGNFGDVDFFARAQLEFAK